MDYTIGLSSLSDMPQLLTVSISVTNDTMSCNHYPQKVVAMSTSQPHSSSPKERFFPKPHQRHRSHLEQPPSELTERTRQQTRFNRLIELLAEQNFRQIWQLSCLLSGTGGMVLAAWYAIPRETGDIEILILVGPDGSTTGRSVITGIKAGQEEVMVGEIKRLANKQTPMHGPLVCYYRLVDNDEVGWCLNVVTGQEVGPQQDVRDIVPGAADEVQLLAADNGEQVVLTSQGNVTTVSPAESVSLRYLQGLRQLQTILEQQLQTAATPQRIVFRKTGTDSIQVVGYDHNTASAENAFSQVELPNYSDQIIQVTTTKDGQILVVSYIAVNERNNEVTHLTANQPTGALPTRSLIQFWSFDQQEVLAQAAQGSLEQVQPLGYRELLADASAVENVWPVQDGFVVLADDQQLLYVHFSDLRWQKMQLAHFSRQGLVSAVGNSSIPAILEVRDQGENLTVVADTPNLANNTVVTYDRRTAEIDQLTPRTVNPTQAFVVQIPAEGTVSQLGVTGFLTLELYAALLLAMGLSSRRLGRTINRALLGNHQD